MPKEIMKDLTIYEIPELATLLGLHKITLQRYLREGRLKGNKIGKRWLIAGDSLRDFLCGVEDRPLMSSYLKRREGLFR